MTKNKTISWCEKYELSLHENLSLSQIMLLRDVCMYTARKIKAQAIQYCLENNIEIISTYQIPTEAVLKVTHKDIEYYYTKMSLEARINSVEDNHVNS